MAPVNRQIVFVFFNESSYDETGRFRWRQRRVLDCYQSSWNCREYWSSSEQMNKETTSNKKEILSKGGANTMSGCNEENLPKIETKRTLKPRIRKKELEFFGKEELEKSDTHRTYRKQKRTGEAMVNLPDEFM